jgi:ribosomal protein S27E
MDFNVVMEYLNKSHEHNKLYLELFRKYSFPFNEIQEQEQNVDYGQSIINFLTEYEKLSKKEKKIKPRKLDWFNEVECRICGAITEPKSNGKHPLRCHECGQIFDWSEWNE